MLMMDDMFFEAPARCDVCHGLFDSGSMVWANGRCLCLKCYETSMKEGKTNDEQGLCGTDNQQDRAS